MPTINDRLKAFINPPNGKLGSVTVKVDDSSGWTSLTGRPQDYDPSEIYQIYQDALTAWRKNPIAWRIINITTDYVVASGIQISSPNRSMQKFLSQFWNHPKNMLSLRLESMSDELARAGDLFVLLFRNPQDGMSYIRFVTKDRIQRIETAANDWETELVYHETQDVGNTKQWYGVEHPDAAQQDAVMIHYTVNKPTGAIMGESDLTTMIPWLLRYSRLLEDRVRLHWAIRAFLWIVTVPSNKIREKTEQYRNPPDSGSIIVKDETEKWEVYAPSLNASDAQSDFRAVRGMVDAGSGYPPHWRGEGGDINLATATAMQSPAERHLTRRQNYFTYLLQDIIYHAYQRAYELGMARRLSTNDYSKLFIVSSPDISRTDNTTLASAAGSIANAFNNLSNQIITNKPLARHAIRLAFKFAGEHISEEEIDQILNEQAAKPVEPVEEEGRNYEE